MLEVSNFQFNINRVKTNVLHRKPSNASRASLDSKAFTDDNFRAMYAGHERAIKQYVQELLTRMLDVIAPYESTVDQVFDSEEERLFFQNEKLRSHTESSLNVRIQMKTQLSDTADIVVALDLAPPTKQLMHWKRTGGSEKLFAFPERPLPSRVLLNYYTRNLVTSRIEGDEEPFIEEQDELTNGDLHLDDQDAHQQIPLAKRRMSERIANMEELELEQMPPPASPTKGRKTQKPRITTPEKSTKKRRRQDKENDGSQTPRSKTPRADSERFSHHLEEQQFELSENSREVGRDPSLVGGDSLRQSRVAEPEFQEEEDYQEDNYEQPLSVGPVSFFTSNCLIEF